MDHCYRCAGEVGPDGAHVCGACLRQPLAAPAVRSTAEFAAVAPSLEPPPAHAPPVAADGCTWCGKPAAEVRKLLGNGAVAICDGCVALCVDVLHAELGDGWRG